MDISINQENELKEVENLEDDEVIEQTKAYENLEEMAPDDKIAYWKEMHHKIYLSVYDEQEFVWRKLKRREYTEIMNDTPDEELNDVVEHRQYLTIMTCLLSPDATDQAYIDDILEEYPGLITSLSAEILKKSGFSKPLTIEI